MSDRPDNLQHQASPATEAEEVALDDLLHSAMKARPEPAAPADLAMRAMALAVTNESAGVANVTHALARQRRWGQFASIAAAMIIAAVIAFAGHRIWANNQSENAAVSTVTSADTASDETASTDTDSSSASTSSTSSTSGTIAVVFVAEILVLGIVLISMTRRAPTKSWGAEALAGFW